MHDATTELIKKGRRGGGEGRGGGGGGGAFGSTCYSFQNWKPQEITIHPSFEGEGGAGPPICPPKSSSHI